MVPKQWVGKFAGVVKKYRYAIIVLLIGLLLMAIPNVGGGIRTTDLKADTLSESPVEALEHKLSLLLSKVEGAG